MKHTNFNYISHAVQNLKKKNWVKDKIKGKMKEYIETN